jgi:hypothetical protein
LLVLGPRRLRDVPTPVWVFQVRAPGLQADFPALRALDKESRDIRKKCPLLNDTVARHTK